MIATKTEGFWTLIGILSVATLIEVALFIVRHQVPKNCIVPALLGLSSVKFAMVIDWYIRSGRVPGLMPRVVPTAFVSLGGTALALVASYGL